MAFLDQMGTTVSLSKPPKRIISLVPSQTELLFDLGLDQEVIGITKFCVHPPSWRFTKLIVGGTKNFWFDSIDQANPDLIIGNKEENYQEGIVKLQQKYPVWMSDILTLGDALSMINAIGLLTGRAGEAKVLADNILFRFTTIHKVKPKRVLYLIWYNPWMAAGAGTFIDYMLGLIGFQNCLAHLSRYPIVSIEDITHLQPDYILLSSEPYPFQQKHKDELLRSSPSATILFVDGEMFSWYGSRLRKAPDYFNTLSVER